MDRLQQRGMIRILAYLGAVLLAVCYGAYQANPKLAIGCVAVIGVFAGLGLALSRYKERQVKKMVAAVDALDRRA